MAWSRSTDLAFSNDKRRALFLRPYGLGTVLAIIIALWNIQIGITFHKPSCIRIFYDGDFNGTGIDFKEDGTYIYDNCSMGFSNFHSGTYKLKGDLIILDRNNLECINTYCFILDPLEENIRME